jgi:hypothetical protein
LVGQFGFFVWGIEAVFKLQHNPRHLSDKWIFSIGVGIWIV